MQSLLELFHILFVRHLCILVWSCHPGILRIIGCPLRREVCLFITSWIISGINGWGSSLLFKMLLLGFIWTVCYLWNQPVCQGHSYHYRITYLKRWTSPLSKMPIFYPIFQAGTQRTLPPQPYIQLLDRS